MTPKITPKMTMASEILAERMIDVAVSHFGLPVNVVKTNDHVLFVTFDWGTLGISKNVGNNWVFLTHKNPCVVSGNGIRTLKRFLKTY